MSSNLGQDGDVIELTCRLGQLDISIRGPSTQAAELLSYITPRDRPPRALSPVTTDRSFEFEESVLFCPQLPWFGISHCVQLSRILLVCNWDSLYLTIYWPRLPFTDRHESTFL